MEIYITTYTGKHFEPTNPDPEMIRAEEWCRENRVRYFRKDGRE